MLPISEIDFFYDIHFLQSITTSIQEGVIILDKRGRIVSFNQQATEILKLDPHQILNRSPAETTWNAIAPDGRKIPGQELPVSITLRTGVPQKNVILGILAANNPMLWVSVNSRMIRTSKNEVYVFATFIDVTQLIASNHSLEAEQEKLRSSETALKRKINQLKDFAGIITHDVRGPVGNIKRMLEIYETASDNETKDTAFQHLKKTSSELAGNLNELIQVIQIHLEKNVPNSECDFKALTDSVSMQLQNSIAQNGATIVTDFQVPTIHYPRVYLQSILYNLVSNALKYTNADTPPVIRISSFLKDGKRHLSVSDNGLGIDMQKYGNALFQFQKSFHAGFDSRGIGLYLVKNQVEDLGGTITAESKVGEGTTFTIRF